LDGSAVSEICENDRPALGGEHPVDDPAELGRAGEGSAGAEAASKRCHELAWKRLPVQSRRKRVRARRKLGRVLAPRWDDRDAFSVEEAGTILGISRMSAYAAAKRGDLPVIWIGRRAIVPRLALERLLGGTA
jgi:hypothetical protein